MFRFELYLTVLQRVCKHANWPVGTVHIILAMLEFERKEFISFERRSHW